MIINRRLQVDLLKRASLLLMLGTLTGSVAIHTLTVQPAAFLYLCLFNSVIVTVVTIFIWKEPSRPSNGTITVSLCVYLCFVPTILTGGIDSQFACLLPLLPLIFSLIFGRKAAWVLAAGILSILFMMTIWPNYVIDITNMHVFQSESYLRAIWLIIATICSTVFATMFLQINEDLNIKLKRHAFSDPLTGIPNRKSILQFCDATLFTKSQATEAATTGCVGILLLDIDNIKAINDLHGHEFGDKCLIEVAHVLNTSIRQESDSIGRYGGEEFLICLQTDTKEQVMAVAEKLRQAVENLKIASDSGSTHQVSISIGVMTVVSDIGIDTGSLVSLADMALTRAKSDGRNTIAHY